MMTIVEQQTICMLIKTALSKTAPKQPIAFDIEPYIGFATQQQIEALLITGARLNNNPIPIKVKQHYYAHVFASEQQLDILHRLYEAFEQHSIDYLPLKGAILKSLYPSAELRSMSDLDILIKPEQYDSIKSVMLLLGFSEGVESDHELVWRKNIIMVELHKRLIPSYNKDYYKYYGDEWRLAHPIGNSYQYEMSPEDTFIYLFTHFAKHYRDKGVGIRQAVDLYVYQKAYPNLNMSYIENQLTLLQLERFYFNVSHMLHTWFDSAEHTEASALISNRIFSGSVFGMEQDGQVSAMLKERNSTGSLVNAKASSWIKAIFPPLFGMQQLYPILKK